MYLRKMLVMLTLIPASHASMAQGKKTDTLPAPYATKSSMNFSKVIGWKDGKMPVAPAGFTVTRYADGFQNPRWLYVTPNNDVLVAESNANYTLVQKAGAVVLGAN